MSLLSTHVTPKHLSFAEVVKDRIIIGVLEGSNSPGAVDAVLTFSTLQVLEKKQQHPSCRDIGGLKSQTKIVACDNAWLVFFD